MQRDPVLAMITIEEAALSLHLGFLRSLRATSYGACFIIGLWQGAVLEAKELPPANGIACDAASWALYIAKAQSLASETESMGRTIITCPSGDYRQAGLYWLAFYLHMTQQNAAFSQTFKLLPAPTGSDKNMVRYRAWNGDTETLKSKVQNSEKGYFDDPEMTLALARASMRAGLYKDGLQNFEIYLKQRESDEAVEAERLFAYLWAGDKQAARLQIGSMRRYAVSPYLRQSLDRAEALLGPEDVIASSEWLGSKGTWLRISGNEYSDNRGFERRGIGLAYNGPVEIGVDAFESRHPLDPETENQASLNLGKTLSGSSWKAGARVGYFTVGPQNFTGRLQAEWLPLDSLLVGVAAQREAIAVLDRPLVGARRGVMRDTGEFLLGGFRRRISFKAAFNRDDEKAFFELYEAELRIGALLNRETDLGFGFFIPISYQHRPLPSQDLVTFPKEARTGLGLRLALGDGATLRVGTEALIETVFRSYFIEPDDFEQLLSARVRSDIRYYTSSSFCYFLNAELKLTERNPFENENERKTAFTIGIALRDTEQQK